MLDERQRAFTAKLPRLQQSGNLEQFEKLSQRRDQFAAQIEAVEANEEYRVLAQAGESEHFERLQRVSDTIDRIGTQRNTSDQQDMLRLLSGMLDYQLATEYPARIWKARKQLIQLEHALGEARQRVQSLRQITARTERDIAGYKTRIGGQSDRITALRQRVDDLMQQQEQLINQLGIDAIGAQSQHVKQLRLNARFELARIYDKLAETQ
jgi:chromosome segregation ATPase